MALTETNSELEKLYSGTTSEFETYKNKMTSLVSLKSSEISELELKVNSLQTLATKNEEDHTDEVETLAMKISSLEEKLEENYLQ